MTKTTKKLIIDRIKSLKDFIFILEDLEMSLMLDKIPPSAIKMIRKLRKQIADLEKDLNETH